MAGEEGTYAQQFGDEFQAHILAVMSRVPGFVIRYRTALDSSYFISNLHQMIAGALLTHADEHHSLPTQVTLVELCKELGDGELDDKLKTSVGKLFKRDISDAPTVIAKTVEFGKTQAMVNAVLDAGEEIDKGNRQIMPIIHKAQLVGEDILNLGVDFKATLAGRMLTYMTPPDKVQEWEVIPTGIAHLDYALEGGLSRGELGVVLAPPKRGKCVDGATLVWTPERGYVTMKEVVESRPDVVGITETDNRPVIAPVIGSSADGNKKIAKIKLRSGREVFGFAETHPVLTIDGWRRTDDLRAGDYVMGLRKLPLSGESTPAERREAWLHGVMTGDGGLTGVAPLLNTHLTDDEDTRAQIDAWFPGLMGSARREGANGLRVGISRSYWPIADAWGVAHVKSPERRVPPRVWKCGLETVAAFVAGLFDADGSAYMNGDCPVIEWTLASHSLCTDLLAALNVLGVYATIRYKKVILDEKEYDAWRVALRDGSSIKAFVRACRRYGAHLRKWGTAARAREGRGSFYARAPHRVWEWVLEHLGGATRWSPRNVAVLFHELPLGVQPRKASGYVHRAVKRRSRVGLDVVKAISEHIPEDKRFRQIAEGHFVYDEVVSVEWVKTGPTLDIEVEGSAHSFLAEGLMTHNTTTLINLGFGCITSVLGFNVVHYTCEMADRKIARRYDDRVLGNDVKFKLTDPKKFTQRLKKKIKTLVTGGLFIKGYPTRSATSSMIRNHLYLLASEGFIPDLVIVDYADIMKAERRLEGMRHEQAGIYEDLRQIAGEFNVAMWTASQAPKGALEKPLLDLGDFAEAFEKAAIVDAAVAFCQTADERLKAECRLALIGLRWAEDGRMVLCEISRKKCYLRSKGLIDQGQVPIPTPLDLEEDQESVMQTTTTLHKAVEAFQKKGGPKQGGVEKKLSASIAKKKKKKPSKKVDQEG